MTWILSLQSVSYCVIHVYRDEPYASEIISFLKQKNWDYNAKETDNKQKSFVKDWSCETKDWALLFCRNTRLCIDKEKEGLEVPIAENNSYEEMES